MVSFVLAIDAYSDHIWCAPLRNKSGPTVRKALNEIFDTIMRPIENVNVNYAISEVSTDQVLKRSLWYSLIDRQSGHGFVSNQFFIECSTKVSVSLNRAVSSSPTKTFSKTGRFTSLLNTAKTRKVNLCF
jgi:hypothetical protein